jgi:hypothetical protein
MAICNDLIKKLRRPRFFTLTIDRSHSIEEAWRLISTWWKAMRDKIRRWLEKLDMPKMVYFAVLEAHNDGYPHIHGFWNFYIQTNVLSRMWSECAPGYVVDVRAVDNEKQATDYLFSEIGKYLGKEQSIRGARATRYRHRTFWRSKGLLTDFELDKKNRVKDNKGWTLVKEKKRGKTQQERPNMETACCAISEKSVDGGVTQMDSPKSESGAMQASWDMYGQARQDER